MGEGVLVLPLPLLHLHEVCGAGPAYSASRPNFRSREQYRGLLDPFGRFDEGGHSSAGDGLQVGELEGHSLESGPVHALPPHQGQVLGEEEKGVPHLHGMHVRWPRLLSPQSIVI